MQEKIIKLNKEELEVLILKHKSINSLLKEIGVNSNGSGAYKTFKFHCINLEIPIPNYSRLSNKIGVKQNMTDILVENSTYQNAVTLKKRLINENYLEYKCNKCNNNGEWMNNPLTLQLDHINGKHNDNRIENLRFLCPNCHTQTETFGSKKLKKCKVKKPRPRKILVRPNMDTLLKDITELGYSATGRKYGVSDNAIRQWIK